MYRYTAPWWGVTTGVVQQVEEHLGDAVAIGQDGRSAGRDLVAQRDAGLFAFGANYRQHFIDQGVHVQGSKVELHVARFERRHVLHIAHQAAQTLHLAPYQLRRFGTRLRLGNHLVRQRLAEALDSGEGRDEIVGDVGDHVAAQLFLAAQFCHV